MISFYRELASRARPHKATLLGLSVGLPILAAALGLGIGFLLPDSGSSAIIGFYVLIPPGVWSWGCVLAIVWFKGPADDRATFLQRFGLVIAAVFLSLWMISPLALLAFIFL